MNRRLLILLLFASSSSFSSAQNVDPAQSFIFAELESRPMPWWNSPNWTRRSPSNSYHGPGSRLGFRLTVGQ